MKNVAHKNLSIDGTVMAFTN